MEEHIVKTLIESPYPFWMTILLFAAVSGGIQFIITFCKELAKRKVEKETTAAITTQIKSVEAKFTTEVETLKSALSVRSQTQTQFILQRNEAIVDFWSKYMNWNETFMGSWRNNPDNNHIINELLQKEEDNNLAATLAYHKLILYIDDGLYIKNVHELLYKMSEIIFNQRMLLIEIEQINLNNPYNKVERHQKLGLFSVECKKLQGEDVKKLTNKFIEESKKYLSDANIK